MHTGRVVQENSAASGNSSNAVNLFCEFFFKFSLFNVAQKRVHSDESVVLQEST